MTDDLDRDIWSPFSRTFAAGDLDGYLAFHSPEFTYVRAEAGVIMGFAEYAEGMRQSFDSRAARGISVTIAFAFTERIVSPELASERGVFRMSGPGPDLYGRFHTIAKHTEAGWRLVLDYENGEGVSAADFAS